MHGNRADDEVVGRLAPGTLIRNMQAGGCALGDLRYSAHPRDHGRDLTCHVIREARMAKDRVRP